MDGSLTWCLDCQRAYRSGEGRMSQEQRRAVRLAAAEKQRETLAAKRAEQSFWKDAKAPRKPKQPRAQREQRADEPMPVGGLRHGPLSPMKERGWKLPDDAHVIGEIHFPRSDDDVRYVKCAGCDFAVWDAPTDDAMGVAFLKHAKASRRDKSGPVERVAPAHSEDDDEDELDDNAA